MSCRSPRDARSRRVSVTRSMRCSMAATVASSPRRSSTCRSHRRSSCARARVRSDRSRGVRYNSRREPFCHATHVSSPAPARRVLSGMRPTGPLHLGNWHGALRNWVELQYQYECFFFIADWHALTTGYEETAKLEEYVWTMAVDWLAAGLNPGVATLFIQSKVPEHAELHLLLSMITPLGWLERVPSYRDQQAQLADRDLSTYGFLGYPLLQSADILLYRSQFVPVGE